MNRTGRPPTLTRDLIVDAVTKLLESDTGDPITTRTIGDALGVHPTALYRHFRDMDELFRVAADRVLDDVVPEAERGSPVDGLTTDAALDAVSETCTRLRNTLMSHPGAATVLARGPSRGPNERTLTERLLSLLAQSRLGEADTALAYHALIEFVVGSAAIDVHAGRTTDEDSTHRAWRAEYAIVSPDQFPATSRLVERLYPSQEEQFAFGLDLMIQSLRGRAKVV